MPCVSPQGLSRMPLSISPGALTQSPCQLPSNVAGPEQSCPDPEAFRSTMENTFNLLKQVGHAIIAVQALCLIGVWDCRLT